MNDSDKQLIGEAKAIIKKCFKEGYHHIGAALRTKSGNRYSAVHLEATVGRIAVCAEAIAIGMAASRNDANIDTIVAVDKNGTVVSPCGMCRELITDYSPTAKAIIPGNAQENVVQISMLLPHKYERT